MTKIIAEIASGHNGDLELAKALIKSAAENGASICKFQDWRADNVPKNDPDKQRYEKYQFKDEWYPILIKECENNGVEFLTTCFNADRASYLASLGLKKIKLASISLTNTELIMACGANFDEIILSTAMHTKEEIEEAIDLLESNAKKYTILHCVANYPTLPEDANLERINEIKKLIPDFGEFGSGAVGYSSHLLDVETVKIAMCKNIKYLEVHFSLSRDLPQIEHTMFKGGKPLTTHSISLEPHELLELSKWRDKIEVVEGKKDFTINEIESKIKEHYLNRYGK